MSRSIGEIKNNVDDIFGKIEYVTSSIDSITTNVQSSSKQIEKTTDGFTEIAKTAASLDENTSNFLTKL